MIPNVDEIKSPYFFDETDLPGIDFCRELIEPGKSESFPDGVVGIRVDDDFWAVAALPWSWRFYDLKDIVAVLWPHYINEAKFAPDSGTVEQRFYFLEAEIDKLRDENRYLNELLKKQDVEIFRLKEGKQTVGSPINFLRKRKMDLYFIAQYEQLVTAMAHTAIPYKEDGKGGICSVCNLLVSDRVHGETFKLKKAKGIDPLKNIIALYDE